jgi:hypothetical protein
LILVRPERAAGPRRLRAEGAENPARATNKAPAASGGLCRSGRPVVPAKAGTPGRVISGLRAGAAGRRRDLALGSQPPLGRRGLHEAHGAPARPTQANGKSQAATRSDPSASQEHPVKLR